MKITLSWSDKQNQLQPWVILYIDHHKLGLHVLKCDNRKSIMLSTAFKTISMLKDVRYWEYFSISSSQSIHSACMTSFYFWKTWFIFSSLRNLCLGQSKLRSVNCSSQKDSSCTGAIITCTISMADLQLYDLGICVIKTLTDFTMFICFDPNP